MEGNIKHFPNPSFVQLALKLTFTILICKIRFKSSYVMGLYNAHLKFRSNTVDVKINSQFYLLTIFEEPLNFSINVT